MSLLVLILTLKKKQPIRFHLRKESKTQMIVENLETPRAVDEGGVVMEDVGYPRHQLFVARYGSTIIDSPRARTGAQ